MHNVSLLGMGAVGFLAQMVDGTLGMGYGVTSAALLVSLGVNPLVASASIHTSELVITLVSGVSHFKFGNIRRDFLWPLISFGAIGGILGACGLVKFPSKYIKLGVGVILLSMGGLILYRFLLQYRKLNVQTKPYPANKLRALGFFAAFIDAIGGGGWGPICTPTLIVNGTEPNKAVGSVDFSEFFVTLAITSTFFILMGFEQFRWDIVFAFLIGGIIAAPIAAFACNKLPKRILGICVGLLVIILSLRMILRR